MFIGPAKEANRRIHLRQGYGGQVDESALAKAMADKSANRRLGAFTLLEIMLAVAILGMMSLAIFRFVQANLTALSLSSETVAADAQYDGLRDLLTAHWQSLSPTRAAMIGEVFKLSDR